MKHIFIINPTAGKKNVTNEVINQVKCILSHDQYEIYVTKGIGDAKKYIKELLSNSHEQVRLYACGGDGTLNEVISGAYGFDNATVTCYPCGSGNDFVKVFGERSYFLDIKNLVNGKDINVDLLKLNGYFSINICNIGFDALVGHKMMMFKRWPFVSGKSAYNLGVVSALFSKMGNNFKLFIDDKEVYNGKGLLCAVANGICYGGSFHCSPESIINDGHANIVFVKKISRFTLARFIKFYKKGTHLQNEKLKKYIIYDIGKKVKIESNKEFKYSFDGEIGSSKRLEIEVIPNSIKFSIPYGLDYNK